MPANDRGSEEGCGYRERKEGGGGDRNPRKRAAGAMGNRKHRSGG